MSAENNPQVERAAKPAATSLLDMLSEGPQVVTSERVVSRAVWIRAAILTLLVGAFFRDSLTLLYGRLSEPNWTYGYMIPLFSAMLLYFWRDELFRAPRRVCSWGLVVVIVSMLAKAYAEVVLTNNWATQLTLPLMVWGLILWLCGPRVAKICFVPVFYLCLAMPWPDGLYTRISVPLQNFAAQASASILRAFGVTINVTNSSLDITSVSGKIHPLVVAEACSGIRSLLGFFALGVAMAFVQPRYRWQQVMLIFGGIPIAIFTNVLRVTITATMFVQDKPELGRDFMHTATGVVLMIPALLLLILLGMLLDMMYIDGDDEDEEADEDGGNTDAPDGEEQA